VIHSPKQPTSGKLPRPLRRAELPQDTEALARYLIGKTLVRETPRGRIVGRIVETEAYVLGDSAGHGFRGETPRNRSLFLQRGHAYVYFIYGMHYALNVSAGAQGQGTGVLIRALEPLEGIEQMQKNRGMKNIHQLAKGPGRLAEALQIDKRLDGTDLCVAPAASRRFSANKSRPRHPLWLAESLTPTAAISASKRIGITKEIHRPLRFYERNNPYVSGPKRLNQ
jgi:DNA-3-methyladenine glycosylase